MLRTIRQSVSERCHLRIGQPSETSNKSRLRHRADLKGIGGGQLTEAIRFIRLESHHPWGYRVAVLLLGNRDDDFQR
jgi:hypothetical protein